MKPKPTSKNEAAIVRSSAAEYLTFVAASGQGGVEAVLADIELQADSVIRKSRITAADVRAVPRMTSDEAGTGQSLLAFMQRSPLADEPHIDLIRNTHDTRRVAL
jgi:hypothetical protein